MKRILVVLVSLFWAGQVSADFRYAGFLTGEGGKLQDSCGENRKFESEIGLDATSDKEKGLMFRYSYNFFFGESSETRTEKIAVWLTVHSGTEIFSLAEGGLMPIGAQIGEKLESTKDNPMGYRSRSRPMMWS